MNLSELTLSKYKKNEGLSALRLKWLRRAASESTDFPGLYCLYEITLGLSEKYPEKLSQLKSISHSIKLKLTEMQSE